MKILFVNEKCGYYGGVEQNIADTAAGMRDIKGHACYLLYGTATEAGEKEYRQLFEKCIKIDTIDLKSDRQLQAIQNIVFDINPDVLYVHKIPSVRILSGLIESIHSVRMVHDHDLCCPRKHKYFAYSGRICTYKAGLRCWFDGAFLERDESSRLGASYSSIGAKMEEMRRNYKISRLLVGSTFMKNELIMNGFPQNRIFIIPPVIQNAGQEKVELPADNMILFVGQLIRGKGVDLLLNAFTNITVDYRAVIVGDGNARDELAELSSNLGLADRVQFAGWIDHDQLQRYYSEAAVVAVPSRWPEPFGMVGLEAMKYGRPVVGFNVGGIKDWLEHKVTGILVPEQDVEKFAEALEQMLSDKEAAKSYGENGYKRMSEKYCFEEYLNKLEGHLTP